ncbi:hypothetical protein R70006_03794 [Paraburkholderia domus]|nr:hypothetical protein R70006_03794 [Paraburkholderia domus]
MRPLAQAIVLLATIAVVENGKAQNIPEERWGKQVTATSPSGGQNAESNFETIVAPPGYAIALDRLDIRQECSCNEVPADPPNNCPITFNPNTAHRISYKVIARPTADNSQRCNTTVRVGYFLVPEK